MALFAAEDLLRTALVAGAMSVDAARGSDTPFDARIHALRGQAGQIRVAAALRGLLAGSQIRESHKDCGRVQDAWTRPASITAWSLLVARSWRGRRAGSLTWKGRALPDPTGAR